jgi:hypothetical protein
MTSSFSLTQQDIILGSLLGDGSISKQRTPTSSCYFTKPQATARRAYLEWHSEQLQPHSSSINEYDNWAEGKKYQKSVFLTKTHQWFVELRNKWYPEGTKIVPQDLKLTPLMVAVWFFDDGSNDLDTRVARFATNGFTRFDCEFLVDQLTSLSIKSKTTKQGQINVLAESYGTLVDLVKPFMLWDCFKHKIAYRDPEFTPVSTAELNRILKLLDDGNSLKEIAETIGRSISAISAKIKKERPTSIALNNTTGYKNIVFETKRNKWKVSLLRNGLRRQARFDTIKQAIEFRDSLCHV